MSILQFPLNTSTPGGGGAPADAEYLLLASNGGLTSARVFTDNTVIAKDTATAGQFKLVLVDGGISTAKLANNAVDNAKSAQMPGSSIKLNNAAGLANAIDFVLGNSNLLGTDDTGIIKALTLGSRLTMTGAELNALVPSQADIFALANFALIDGSGNITNEAGTIISGVLADTWANRPSAAANSGLYFFCTNVGINGCMMRSNGTRWIPLHDVTLERVCFGASPVNRTTAGAFTGTGVTIPANLLGANDKLLCKDIYRRNGTDAVAPVYRIYMGTNGTPSSNALVYTQGIANSDNQQIS